MNTAFRMFVVLDLSLVLFSGMTVQTHASESFTVTVGLYQGFDISTGMTELDPTVITIIIGSGQEIDTISAPSIDPLFEFSPSADLFFGFNTDADLPVSVFAEQINGMTVIRETAFDAVTGNMLLQLELDADIQAITIDSDDLIVLLTTDDDYVVLGDVMLLPDAQLRLTYRTTSDGTAPVPEPGTLLLVGAGLIGLLGITQQKRKKSQGGRFMKYGKVLLLVLVLGVIFAGIAPAAELRIITKGTGYGMVLGEQILCPDICQKTYDEGTVVHLKAEPFPDSRFAGWLINGEPHKGVVTIEKDIVVTAIFESITGLDDLTVYWYNGSVKEQAAIATDEMYLFLEKREKWKTDTEEEYEAAIREIVQQFHPEAKIVGEVGRAMTLKSPEPLTKDRWFQALSSLKELHYVRYGGPILYTDPESRFGLRLPTDKISARFPASYTEEQIQAIEQEYGLVRLKAYDLDPNDFYYYVGEPLHAIDVANRLYESGKVESASPEIIIQYELKAFPDDEYFQNGTQWHLSNTMIGYRGEDINVIDAWDLTDGKGKKIRGTGVTISIVDDGIEIAHDDLWRNVLNTKCYDFFEEDNDPIDNEDEEGIEVAEDIYENPNPSPQKCIDPGCHGTPVAGVAAAEGFNKIGVCGVAPDAALVGYRTISSSGRYSLPLPKKVNALIRNMDTIHIYNNSWLPPTLAKVDERMLKAIQKGVGVGEYKDQGGRQGKGNIYVFAGGNIGDGDLNSNYHEFANSRYTITVSGTGFTGRSLTVPGANILVNAPTGIATTDLSGEKGFEQAVGVYINLQYLRNIFGAGVPRDVFDSLNTPEFLDKRYTEDTLLTTIEQFIGTEKTEAYRDIFLEQANFGPPTSSDYFTLFMGSSAAAPVVSGVVALMLQANPDLSWRDVQHILIETAEKNDCSENSCDDDWIANGAGYHINHKYGFGRVDATAAVTMALNWIPLSERGLREVEEIHIGSEVGNFESDHGVSNSVPMGILEGNLRVDFVEVIFTTPDHDQWTDLEIILTSPFGTKSVLAEPHDPPISGKFSAWKFGSVRYFGESSSGDWTLTVKDLRKGNGQHGLKGFSWDVKIYGTELPTWSLETLEPSKCRQEGGGVSCWFPDGEGRVGLIPLDVEREDLQYAFLDLPEDPDQEPDWEIRHAGTYWFPARRDDQDPSPKLTFAFNLNVRKWLAEFFQPDSTTLPCDEDPPDIEEEVHDIGVLEMEEIVVDETHRRCRVTLQIGAHPVIRAEFQSVVACDEVLFLPDLPSDTLTANVTYQWEAGQRDDQAPNWIPADSESKTDTKTTRWGSTHHRREYYLEGLLGTAFLVKAMERCHPQDSSRWYHSMWPNQIRPPIPPAVDCPASPPVRSSGSTLPVTSCVAAVSGGGVPTLEERAISAVPREAWCSYIKDYRFLGKCYGLWEYYAADPHICEDGTLTEIKARRFTYEVTTTEVTWQPMGESCQQTYLRTPTEIVLETPLPQFLALFDMERATQGGDDSATTFPPDLDPGSDDDGGPEPDPDEEPQ